MYLEFNTMIATVKTLSDVALFEMFLFLDMELLKKVDLIPKDTGIWLKDMTNRVCHFFHLHIIRLTRDNNIFSLMEFNKAVASEQYIFFPTWKNGETPFLIEYNLNPGIGTLEEIKEIYGAQLTLDWLIVEYDFMKVYIDGRNSVGSFDMINVEKMETIRLGMLGKPPTNFNLTHERGKRW